MSDSPTDNDQSGVSIGDVRDWLFGHLADQGEAELKQHGDRWTAAALQADPPDGDQDVEVGIIGGGQAGLYAALLLESVGIRYRILESSPEHLGGRVDTRYFSQRAHEYAELGAMRFPTSLLQDRLFRAWDFLNATSDGVNGARPIPRIPYVLFDDAQGGDPAPGSGNLLCYNGCTPVTRNKVTKDPSLLRFEQFFDGPQWDRFKTAGRLMTAGALQQASLQWMLDLFRQGKPQEAINQLLKLSNYSARSYLETFGDRPPPGVSPATPGSIGPYPSRIVDYMETTQSYTGIFDTSFTEYALDYFSFENLDPEAPRRKDWWAMDGGTSRITEELVNRIPVGRIMTGATVRRLEEGPSKAIVHYRDEYGADRQLAFDRVIVTLPFNILRMVDTPRTWSAGKYEAIRTLKMTNAVKVALGFASRFWERPGPYSSGMRGGQSNTDLAVRSVVYPSFGIGQPGPAYLLGTYSWQDDADKWSHLDEDEMFDIILRDLRRLHGDVVDKEFLGKGASVVWNREPRAGGGFAYFGPGQWVDLFQDGQTVEGRFHFAGEHLDLVHYWIAGAYDSAFRTVWEVLVKEGRTQQLPTLRAALGGGLIFPWMYPAIPAFRDSTFALLMNQAAEGLPGRPEADPDVPDPDVPDFAIPSFATDAATASFPDTEKAHR